MKKPHKLLSLLCCFLSVGIITFSACGLLIPNQENPNNNNGGGNNTGNNSTDNNTNYSAIMNEVVFDEYYTNLVNGAKNGTVDTDSGYFDPHPYGFLKKEGYNISNIKNGTLDCRSTSYLARDGYYIQTMVETKASTDYYTCYILKYNLNDQEKEELDDMFTEHYIQAPFYIQEISNQKNAEVVSEAYITEAAYNSFYNGIRNDKETYQELGTEDIDFIFTNYLPEEHGQKYTLQVYVRNKATTLKPHNGKIGQITYLSTVTDKSENINGHLALVTAPKNWYLTDTYLAEYKASIENVTAYNCQYVDLSRYSALEK